jgi:hypothetical protein
MGNAIQKHPDHKVCHGSPPEWVAAQNRRSMFAAIYFKPANAGHN